MEKPTLLQRFHWAFVKLATGNMALDEKFFRNRQSLKSGIPVHRVTSARESVEPTCVMTQRPSAASMLQKKEQHVR